MFMRVYTHTKLKSLESNINNPKGIPCRLELQCNTLNHTKFDDKFNTGLTRFMKKCKFPTKYPCSTGKEVKVKHRARQNTQNMPTCSMEKGKCLHFAHLINQNTHRFLDILQRFVSLTGLTNCIFLTSIYNYPCQKSINITLIYYIKLKLVKLTRLSPRNFTI